MHTSFSGGQVFICENVPLVEFKYHVFTRLPGESDHRQLRSLFFCLCDVFRALINSLVCLLCLWLLFVSNVLSLLLIPEQINKQTNKQKSQLFSESSRGHCGPLRGSRAPPRGGVVPRVQSHPQLAPQDGGNSASGLLRHGHTHLVVSPCCSVNTLESSIENLVHGVHLPKLWHSWEL